MGHKSRIGCIIVDCKTEDLTPAASFWSAALGYEAQPDADFPDYIMLKTTAGEPKMLLQAVNHDSRIHLDIETNDRVCEQNRLEALGAKVVGPCKNWVVMEAPTGHRFCIVDPQRADFEDHATNWNDA
jgi:predicted enzyme related to lactoylglutathione lyase